MVVHDARSLLFSATLKDAVGLKAVLDLVDKDFSQDAGKNEQHRASITVTAAAAAVCTSSVLEPQPAQQAPEHVSVHRPLQALC